MKNTRFNTLLFTVLTLLPIYSYAGVESMMSNLESAILNVLAPVICVCGIIFNAFKMAMGDESAKTKLFWSCIGTIICFTAPAIMSFLQTRVASGQ